MLLFIMSAQPCGAVLPFFCSCAFLSFVPCAWPGGRRALPSHECDLAHGNRARPRAHYPCLTIFPLIISTCPRTTTVTNRVLFVPNLLQTVIHIQHPTYTNRPSMARNRTAKTLGLGGLLLLLVLFSTLSLSLSLSLSLHRLILRREF